MKTALILFKHPDEKLKEGYVKEVADVFITGGFSLDFIDVLPENDSISFKHRFLEYNDKVDNLIIVSSLTLGFDLKNLLCELTDSTLAENDNALNFLQAVGTANGVDYDKDFACIPLESTLIPNISGPFQGFMFDDKEFTVIVLPAELKEYKVMAGKYVLPYLENKFNVKMQKECFKYFGSRKKLFDVLSVAEKNSDGLLRYKATENNGDFTVELIFSGTDSNLFLELTRYIYGELNDNVYANFDTTLEERLFDLLKLKNLKISVAESFTAGRVVSSIIKNSGASQYVDEGIVCYSNQSKHERLSVAESDLKNCGAVSSVVAFDMAAGLLRSNRCAVAISTTGIAGPKSDDTDKPVGLCYIGVGTKDGVHTYKLNISGTREVITETAKNTALFLAIKKLKEI